MHNIIHLLPENYLQVCIYRKVCIYRSKDGFEINLRT